MALAVSKTKTLIVAYNRDAVQQWRRELIDKTTIAARDVGIYTSDERHIRPVTITTYQMLTHRQSRLEDFKHLQLFEAENWGLLIYDEVHLLPAPVFGSTATLQDADG